MRKYIIILICWFLCISVYCQISTRQKPYSWDNTTISLKSNKDVPTVTMPRLDMTAIQEEDEKNEAAGATFRFGISHQVNLTLENSGMWQQTADGGRLWTLRIFSPDAKSINLTYDKFWLPEGAKFYIYSADNNSSLGAFTALNNKGSKKLTKSFATGLLYSNEIVLEYLEPAGVNGGIISIDNVISGYKENQLRHEVADLSSIKFDKENRSIAYVHVGNTRLSGFLVNNTSNNDKAYFLAGCSNSSLQPLDFSNAIFEWGKYTIYPTETTVGARIIKHISLETGLYKYSQVYLLELTENPINNQQHPPYYLGWNTKNETINGGVSFSFSGDNDDEMQFYMKRFSDKITDVFNIYLETDTDGRYYWYYPNNSVLCGVPLLNQNLHVVGVLNQRSSGSTHIRAVAYPVGDLFTTMNLIFNEASGTIRNTLDPLRIIPSSGGSLNGKEAGCKNLTIYNQTISTSRDISGCKIEVQNVTINNNATVLVNGEDIIIKPEFLAATGTTLVISATVSGNARSVSANNLELRNSNQIMRINDEIMGSVSIFPNPTTGLVNLSIPYEMKVSKIEVYNMTGTKVISYAYDENPSAIDLTGKPAGMYILRIHHDGGLHDTKIMLK